MEVRGRERRRVICPRPRFEASEGKQLITSWCIQRCNLQGAHFLFWGSGTLCSANNLPLPALSPMGTRPPTGAISWSPPLWGFWRVLLETPQRGTWPSPEMRISYRLSEMLCPEHFVAMSWRPQPCITRLHQLKLKSCFLPCLKRKTKREPTVWRKGVASLTPLFTLLLAGQLDAASISEERRPDNTIISQSQVLWCQDLPSETFQAAWLLLIVHNAFSRYNYLLWSTTWQCRTKQVCFPVMMSSVVRGSIAVVANDCTKGQWHYSLLTLLQSWVSATWMPCPPAPPDRSNQTRFSSWLLLHPCQLCSSLSSSKCQSSLEFLHV